MNVPLFEDEFFVAMNKKAHLMTHPNKKFSADKHSLLSITRDLVGSYVYPVNRLDRPSSGIVLFAKKPEYLKLVKESWHSTTKKKYIALVRTQFSYSGVRDFPLKHPETKLYQTAVTSYKPIEHFSHSTLLDIEIKTGRHHQIRRHFARTTHHLLGDRKYGKKKYNDYFHSNYGLDRLFLHAYELQIIHPITNKDLLISCPLATELENVLDKMRSKI